MAMDQKDCIMSIYQLPKKQRDKGIKLFLFIANNIINHPNDKKYQIMYYDKIYRKFNERKEFIQLLLYSGFKKLNKPKPILLFHIKHIDLLKCAIQHLMMDQAPYFCNIKHFGAKRSIYISREMTEKMIPFAVNTRMKGKQLYEYMNGSTYLHSFDEFNTGQLRILDYDFYDKQTNEILYCIVDRQNKKNNKGYQWRMRDKLFTLNEIQKTFGISNNKLPQSSRQKQSFINQLNHEDKIKHLIKNKTKQIIHHTKWKKLPIFIKKSNKQRMILSMTTRKFKSDLNQFISNNNENNNNDNNIIPIVIFDNDGGYHIEYVQIVKICNNSVGISYKYDQQKNNIKPTAIHLNKEFIEEQHRLISPEHDCQCLNDFISNIDDLQIGDPNTQNNQLIYYKNQYEKSANFIKDSVKYIAKTASNTANMNTNNLQKWVEKAKKVTTNAKNVDITLDLEPSDFESIYLEPAELGLLDLELLYSADDDPHCMHQQIQSNENIASNHQK